MERQPSPYDSAIQLADLNPHTVVDIDMLQADVCDVSVELVNPEGTRDVKVFRTPSGLGYFISHHETPVAEPTYVDDFDRKVGEIWGQRARGNDEVADALCAEYGIFDTLRPDW